MIKWALLGVPLTILVIIFGLGVPIEMKVGTLNIVGNKFHFYTQSRALASIIGNSRSAYASCQGNQICLSPVSRDRFDASIPIVFEYCENQKSLETPSCLNAALTVKTTTRSWVRAGIRL